MLNSIGNTALVRCREVIRFSEGPLSEARLYIAIIMCRLYYIMKIVSASVKGQPPYKGQKACSQCVCYSEVLLYAYTYTLYNSMVKYSTFWGEGGGGVADDS